MKVPTGAEVRALAHLVATFAGGDSVGDEALLDAVMDAYLSEKEQAVIGHLYLHGPVASPSSLDSDACQSLEDQLALICTVSIGGERTALALNTFGMPYGRLLAART